MGIGDWGLGIGDWAQSPIPNPQSPIPNPHPQLYFILYKQNTILYYKKIIMSETEMVRLKKQISLLSQYNEDLKTQFEEQNIQLGEIQNKYNILSMKYKNIINQNNLLKDKDNLQKIIENSLSEEKEKNNVLKKNNKLLTEKIASYEQMINEKELYIDKLLKENNNLKRDLINLSKDNGKYNYSYTQKLQQENEIINNDKKKLVEDFNKICDQMEDILRENRILRQMADVPENFGIDINKVKLGERIKIEDYKTKIRYLIHQVDELETERAQLKHNIYFLASSFQLNEPPFNLLSKEQKVDLAIYAKKLFEKKNINNNNIEINKCKKCSELNEIIEEKNKYIKSLEEELKSKKAIKHNRLNSTDISSSFKSNKRYEELYDEQSNDNDNINNEQINEIRNLLRQSKDEIEKAINNKTKMNNRGNVYNLYQYNNNYFFNSMNSIKNNKRTEKQIFKRGNNE